MQQAELGSQSNRTNPGSLRSVSRATDVEGGLKASSAPSSKKRSGLKVAASSQLASDLMKGKNGIHMIAPCSPRGSHSSHHYG